MRMLLLRRAAAAAATACALAVGGVPSAALAQAAFATGPLSLTQTLVAARENLDVALARQGLQAARADIVAANRAPYPVASARASQIDLHNGLGPGNILTGKRIERYAGLDWTIERGNKRVLRTAAARRIAEAVEAELADIRVQQQLGALAAWVDLLAAQERLGEVREGVRGAGALAEVARRRVNAGDLALQEQLRAEIEAQRAATELRGVGLERDRAAVGLGIFVGSPAPLALSAEGGWPPLEDVGRAAVDIPTIVEQRADVRAADARLAAAQALFQGALATRRADVTVGASAGHYPGTSNALVELRVQMPLFWGYAQQGEIARAQAQLSQAESGAARARLAASAELQRLRQEALSAGARARSYEADILPRARRVAEQAEFAFRRGALSLTDVLDARRTLRATLLEALVARADHAKADGAWQLRTQPVAFGVPGATAPPEPGSADALPGASALPGNAALPSIHPPGATPLQGGAGPGPTSPPMGGAAPPGGPTGSSAAPPALSRPAGAPGAAPAMATPDATLPDLPAATQPPSATPSTPPPAMLPGPGAAPAAPMLAPAPAPSPRPGDAAATTPLRGR